jgi:hypothetical protein
MLPLFLINQLFLSFPFYALNLELTSHCASPVWQFLHVHQPDRAMAAGVLCTPSRIMLPCPPGGIGSPTGVISPVRTLEDVAETGHRVLSIPIGFFIPQANELVQPTKLLF